MFVFLKAPEAIASKEAQENEFVIDAAIKECKSSLTVFLFGDASSIQRYISSLYVSLWDYSLLYKKIDLNSIVLPIVENNYDILLGEELKECFIWNTFPPCILNTIANNREKKGLAPIQYHPISIDIWDETVIPLDWESSTMIHVKTACVGGTFDCLHFGHKILLTLASIVCDTLVIGLTTDSMLHNKSRYELIRPYKERKEIVLQFLHQIKPSLKVEIHPLVDIYGPSVLMEEIEGIIVSLETIAGAKKINEVRKEKNLKPLRIFTVNRASKYSLSSTFIRDHAICFVFWIKQWIYNWYKASHCIWYLPIGISK